MLGEEGWRPTAAEALDVGLIDAVHDQSAALTQAQALAEQWIVTKKPREIKGESWAKRRLELKAVNAAESHALATAFLSADFIERQRKFLEDKGKDRQAKMFYWLGATRPLWSLLL